MKGLIKYNSMIIDLSQIYLIDSDGENVYLYTKDRVSYRDEFTIKNYSLIEFEKILNNCLEKEKYDSNILNYVEIPIRRK